MATAKQKSHLLPVVASLVVMFSIGIVYIWSVFQQPVINHYGWNPSTVTIVSATMILMFFFGTMIGGFIQDKMSPRFVVLVGAVMFFIGLFTTSLLGSKYPWLMYVTYGGIAGSGVGLAYSGALNSIQKWYPHKRGMASGLSVCAFGLSVVAFTPIIEWLLKLPSFGENAVPLTFRTLAFLFTGIIIVAGLFVKNPGKDYISSLNLPSKFSTGKKQFKPLEVVKTAPFWCFVAIAFFIPTAYMIIIPLVKTLAAARGISNEQATLTVSLMGFASAGSRLVCGPVSDKIGREKTLFIIALLALLSAIFIIFADGWFYTVTVLLIVFAYAGPSSVYPAMSMDLYGEKHSGGNYGMVLMFMGISSPVFTSLSNTLSASGASTGDYSRSFIVASCLSVIPLIAIPLFAVFRKRLQASQK